MVEAATTKVKSFFISSAQLDPFGLLLLSLRPPPFFVPLALSDPPLTLTFALPSYKCKNTTTTKKQLSESRRRSFTLGALAHLLSRGDALSGADPLTSEGVDGSWELPWASIAPIKSWRYIPVPEFFDVAVGKQVGLRSNVGPLHFQFSGPMRPGAGWDAANQAVTFQFTNQKIGIGGTQSPFVDKELANKKGDRVYRFFGFQKSTGVAGARSSGGPLVLLRKVS